MISNTAQCLPCPSAILWDMDGTLIDQTDAIITCYRTVITDLGHPTPSDNVIRRSLGGTLAETMQLFVDADQLDTASKAFRAHFPKIMFDGLIVLSGGMQLIERAYKARIPQALFTNKHGDTARQISRYTGFAKYIPVCVGSVDTDWHKPQPELTRHVLQQIEAQPAGAIIIGDSPTDIAVAQNAGLSGYGVATGAYSVAELLDAGADAAFESLDELNQSLNIPGTLSSPVV
ncbi:HAD family hydrolase [Coraliomargarita sp. SDUM461004]|uniref:phosphoglycolate phosphatase n=1 Tax=Thalassobacterium sedimentorum TaxID=3041258 RepID=A0ABU1AG95_9BACT|nr:HAD family hydrolase [Coraliomargarita sp. SDUM461004]MDQ8193842.1 HAD family hydrolase [Coraliomargarita sp. SDUM461004]